MPIDQCTHEIFLCIVFHFSGCYSSQQLSQNNILLTTIKFKTFQDYLVKFKDFKALNLVQSNSRLFTTFTDPYVLSLLQCSQYTCVTQATAMFTIYMCHSSYCNVHNIHVSLKLLQCSQYTCHSVSYNVHNARVTQSLAMFTIHTILIFVFLTHLDMTSQVNTCM